MVFVADSHRDSAAINPHALAEFRRLLVDEGIQGAELPLVLQYNKRDLPEAMPIAIMNQLLNSSGSHPAIAAVASEGKGTRETLSAMANLLMRKLNA